MGSFRFFIGMSLFNVLFFSSNAITPKCSCNNNVCNAVLDFSTNFQTSKHLCEKMKGQLMTVKSKAASDDVGDLLVDMPGDYWIGLRLPYGRCTNYTSPLKGYIWTTTTFQSEEFTNWKSNDVLCSSACVSISVDLKWTEKSCMEQSAGFLCENVPEHECTSFEEDLRHSEVFYEPNLGCMSGKCEHECNAVDNDHFTCSCEKGYVINRKEQWRCDEKCSEARCPARCERSGTGCNCPDGYILDEEYCVDIDECEQEACGDELYCFNTLGDYECSCREGFMLVDVDKCVKIQHDENRPTDMTTDSVFLEPSLNYTTGHVATVAPGKVIGVLTFILAGIVAVMFFVRYWKQKKDKSSMNSVCDEDCIQSTYS